MEELIDFTELVAKFITSNPQLFLDDESLCSSESKKRHRTEKKSYWESKWGLMIQDPKINNPKSRIAKLFRRRFRVPFRLFNKLIVPECKRVNLFDTKQENMVRIPLEFKILIALRIIGRGAYLACFFSILLAILNLIFLFFYNCYCFLGNVGDDIAEMADGFE